MNSKGSIKHVSQPFVSHNQMMSPPRPSQPLMMPDSYIPSQPGEFGRQPNLVVGTGLGLLLFFGCLLLAGALVELARWLMGLIW